MLPRDKLDLILRRHEELSAKLSEGADGAAIAALSKELSGLDDVVSAIRAFRAAEREIEGLGALVADPTVEAEMRELAQAELAEAQERVESLEHAVRLALLPKDAADAGSAILEVRAGTGGDEAALFAGDLFRMYQKYADLHGWRTEIVSASEGTAGGYKEIIAEVMGRGVFARLKFESGAHRVQRVPDTETQGRIHTSAATVAVLPEARGSRHRHQRGRSEDRHDARARRGRPARQQDGIGDPHHPYADRHRGLRAGRALAAQEPGAGP
jgi:peptide chain release factor 1